MPPAKRASKSTAKAAAPKRTFDEVPAAQRRAILDGEIVRLKTDQYAAHVMAESLRDTGATDEAVAEAEGRVVAFDEVIAKREAERDKIKVDD